MKSDSTTSAIRQRQTGQTKEPSQRHNTQQEQQTDQTAAVLRADSMFNNSFGEHDIYNRTSLHSRLSHFQQQQHNSFDTYPPKRNNQKQQQQKTSSSTSNILQTISKRPMSSRNSPLRNTNTGKFYTKRSAKKSFSESSVEKLHKYTTSDTSSSQEEDELMMSTAADKRRMSRRSSGLQQHKYQPHHTQKGQPLLQSINDDEDDDAARCTTIFGQRSQNISDMIDIGIRVVLVIVFSKLETQPAFKRIIHAEEMWMYKNPRTKDYVSPLALVLTVIFGPFILTLIHLALTKDRRDFRAASWVWTFILGLNGLATSLLKICVGRPRPDYYYRCFPDGVMQLNHNGTGVDNMLELFNCTGNMHDINEGRKSFPSGHSSFAFASFGFITYYVGAKLHAFNHRGRGQSWRFCISITPLVLAALVAVSRICDYHHHWEDVTIGSFIGLFVSYYIYRQYYPSIFSTHCHCPYPRGIYQTAKTITEPTTTTTQYRPRRRLHSYKRVPSEECGEASLLCEGQGDEFSANIEKRPLINEQKTDNKWF